MLESLHITNYALISQAHITLGAGFNVITGETGAGKSIILGALGLLLGGRADAKAVTRSDAKSVTEAVFTVGGYQGLKDYCMANDVEWDDDRCILRREISPSGRSRAFVNDSPVTLSKLREVAVQLIDIHSQHQNQLLSQPDYQLRILDSMAGNAAKLDQYHTLYTSLHRALVKLKSTRSRMEKVRQDEEFIRFQLSQLDALQLIPGESDDLERERDLQAHRAQISHNVTLATGSLTGLETNAASLIETAAEAIDQLDTLLPDAANLVERLEAARTEIDDISQTVAQAADDVNASESQLQEVEERINELQQMCQRHGVETSDQLIAVRDQLRARLQQLEDAPLTIKELEKEARQALSLTREAAQALTTARIQQATQLGQMLLEKATPLGMKNLQCEIRVSPADMGPTGADKVEFLFAFNKNQPLMPVSQTASGGEISRLMLSLKAIIATKMQLPSIIFDEIDTGVSGEVAAKMGQMMSQMSSSLQVTAITHLPQVAALANTHFQVYKEDDETSTHTRITQLLPHQRVTAIAQMLAAGPVSQAALNNAKEMLASREATPL